MSIILRDGIDPDNLGVIDELGNLHVSGPVTISEGTPSPVDAELGLAANYAVLAAAGITNSGSTVVVGGVIGSYPTATETGFPPGIAVIDNADAAAAQIAALTAYNFYSGLAFVSLSASSANLSVLGNGSNASTYLPGNYSAGTSMDIPTSITLDAQGNPNAVFIFKAGSTLTLESGASVLLINGAIANNVVWLVGSSATTVATSTMVGDILANTSITLGGGVLNGRALAGIVTSSGAVTISTATRITVPNSLLTPIGVDVLNFPSSFIVNQGTSPWVVTGTDADNAVNSTTKLPVLAARANAAAPSWTENHEVPLSTDLAGNLRVTGSVTVASAAVTGTTTDGTTTETPFLVVGGESNDATAQYQPIPLGTIGRSVIIEGVAGGTAVPVSGTIAITGTVAVTQSTSPWVDNLTQWASTVLGVPTNFGTTPGAVIAGSVNASLFAGIVALTQTGGALNVNLSTSAATITVGGDETNNNAVPDNTLLGVLPAIANAASPAWTEGFNVLESVDLTGRMRMRGTLTPNTAVPSSDGQMAITALANAVAPTYTEGNLVLHSVDLSGNTRIIGTKLNNSAPPSTQVGVLPALANAVAPTWTEGDQVLLSVTLGGAQRTLLVAGSATIGAVTGTLTNNNAAPTPLSQLGVLPAIANAVAPTWVDGDQVLLSEDLKGNLRTLPSAVYHPSIQAPPINTAITLQADYVGSLFVKPYRRGQTTSKATTIASSSAATTVLAAQSAGIFADISTLIITVTPLANIAADLAFTATLSDGTNNYLFDLDTGKLGSTTLANGLGTLLALTFNPPLPATTAATAWTIALSIATVTVHITVVATLQNGAS